MEELPPRHLSSSSSGSGSSVQLWCAADCDWRLSRAAREIVRVHLEHAWRKLFLEDKDNDIQNNNNNNIWQLLEESVAHYDYPLAQKQETETPYEFLCPLWPERDVLGRYLEEQVVRRVEADPRLLKTTSAQRQASWPGAMVRERKPRKIVPPFVYYQCGVCHKNFTSRYYLDQHLVRKHEDYFERVAMELTASTSASSLLGDGLLLCPAQHWCGHFLGLHDCHAAALELEPYYGPGSAGSGADRDAVYRTLARATAAATSLPSSSCAAHLATVQACHAMIVHCFGRGDDSDPHASIRRRIGRNLNATLCAPPHTASSLSCRSGGEDHLLLLHNLLLSSSSHHGGSASSMLHPDTKPDHFWRHDVWHSEQDHFSPLVVVIVLGLFCFYGYRCLDPATVAADADAGVPRRNDGTKRVPPPPLAETSITTTTTHVKQH